MNERIQALYLKMIEFDHGQPGLIQHFTKVHAYSRLIALQEGMAPEAQEITEAAALVHDIAIPLCIEKYGNDNGRHQEEEGPALVQAMLPELGFTPAQVDRVCWLVAHHHTYTNVNDLDHQILIEADFLVNAYESSHSQDAKQHTLDKIFKTDTGKHIFKNMFDM